MLDDCIAIITLFCGHFCQDELWFTSLQFNSKPSVFKKCCFYPFRVEPRGAYLLTPGLRKCECVFTLIYGNKAASHYNSHSHLWCHHHTDTLITAAVLCVFLSIRFLWAHSRHKHSQQKDQTVWQQQEDDKCVRSSVISWSSREVLHMASAAV